MNKLFSVVLAIALVAAVAYGFVISKQKTALDTELTLVKSALTSMEADLSSTKQALTSTESELASTRQTLASTRQSLISTLAELDSTNQRLSSAQNDLLATRENLDALDAKLKLYEDTMGVKIFSGVQPPLKGAGPIELANKLAATNPTWRQLMAFLQADPTDDNTWTKDVFISGDFAEMLHNNAEAAGIRAAVVGVFFRGETIGHGFTAFKTADKGLVYVEPQSDAIAYVTRGKEYGTLSLHEDILFDYGYYEKLKAARDSYDQKLAAYNQEVEAYNDAYSRYERNLELARSESLPSSWRQSWLNMAEIDQKLFKLKYGRTFEAEEKYLKEQREWLKSIQAQLEDVLFGEPLGIVERIVIYW